MIGYEINEKDIKAVIRYLQIHNPANADREYAIQLLELMKEIAREMIKTDMEFTELLLKALKERKRRTQENNDES